MTRAHTHRRAHTHTHTLNTQGNGQGRGVCVWAGGVHYRDCGSLFSWRKGLTQSQSPQRAPSWLLCSTLCSGVKCKQQKILVSGGKPQPARPITSQPLRHGLSAAFSAELLFRPPSKVHPRLVWLTPRLIGTGQLLRLRCRAVRQAICPVRGQLLFLLW